MQPAADHISILPEGLPAGAISNMTRNSGVVLICEHASPFIPPQLDHLGVSPEGRLSHVAWDPGAIDVARVMSAALDAPLVAANVSRLVYDCNRPPQSDSAMPARSERFDVPGNAQLTKQDRAARVAEIYVPFGGLVTEAIARQKTPPVVVTVHTFTPVFNGATRQTEIGLLHDEDPDLAQRMMACAADHTTLRVTLNEPYSRADGVTHTLAKHGTANALQNVMIEVRNDLVATPENAETVGTALAEMLRASLRGHA